MAGLAESTVQLKVAMCCGVSTPPPRIHDSSELRASRGRRTEIDKGGRKRQDQAEAGLAKNPEQEKLAVYCGLNSPIAQFRLIHHGQSTPAQENPKEIATKSPGGRKTRMWHNIHSRMRRQGSRQ
eukprot:5939316-Pyramimonas_sp.AAC.1